MTDVGGLIQTLRAADVRFITSAGSRALCSALRGRPSISISSTRATPPTLSGVDVDVVTLTHLIRLKRAAGRPKDLEAIAELEALLEERGGV